MAAPNLSARSARAAPAASRGAHRPDHQRQPARPRLARRRQGLVGAASAVALSALRPAGASPSAARSTRASASGATTSRSAGRFGIINFVWWIGIGHAGTLISAILLLFQQKWRTSINRFAEAMTLFAVICALLFPLLHTGRPWFAAYWLMPYPSDHGHLAAVQEPAHLGRVRGLDLLHRSRCCSGSWA